MVILGKRVETLIYNLFEIDLLLFKKLFVVITKSDSVSLVNNLISNSGTNYLGFDEMPEL